MTEQALSAARETSGVPRLTHTLDTADVLGRWRVRWGIGRDSYRVEPGLYRLGEPAASSPVLVTANYKLTVDAVRADTAGLDAWLLVLETYGINVWCAAGKGTFGTRELVGRIMAVGLPEFVEHETLVLPQLGAPGVAAHEVRRLTGYRVVYGPVRSADIGAFLNAGMKATSTMREVTFTLPERAVLVPVELVGAFRRWNLLAPALLLVASGLGPGLWSWETFSSRAPAALGFYLLAIVCGTVGVPLLLPWLPGRSFALKGALLGALAALGAGLSAGLAPVELAAAVLGVAAVSSYAGVQFTGSSTFTSPSGVEWELRRWLPAQMVAAVASLALFVASAWS